MVDLADQTGAQLLESIASVGRRLYESCEKRQAAAGQIVDDPRWSSVNCPFVLSLESQVHVLFHGGMDAYEAGASLMTSRASQQIFSTIRFQNETYCVLHWIAEPAKARWRQNRAYSYAIEQLGSFASMLEEDSRPDDPPDAYEAVTKAKGWLKAAVKLAADDGFAPPEPFPNRQTLFQDHLPQAGYPSFRVQSSMGGHPNLMGSRLFAESSAAGVVSYALESAWDERAFWAGTAGMMLALTCDVVAPVLGWDDWFREQAVPLNQGAGASSDRGAPTKTPGGVCAGYLAARPQRHPRPLTESASFQSPLR